MARTPVVVIVPPGLADGYRLTGIRTEEAGTAAAAGAVLDRLLSGHRSHHGSDDLGYGGPSVIAMHPPYLRALGGHRQRRLAGLNEVLVVALPEGTGPGESIHGAESLRDLLARAVGYEFTFDPEGGTR
jgi:vacuolar-type H+-ATPase subunit F/Vma7